MMPKHPDTETVEIDPEWASALFSAMMELQVTDRGEVIRYIVGEWLVANGYLAFRDVEEDSQVEGSA